MKTTNGSLKVPSKVQKKTLLFLLIFGFILCRSHDVRASSIPGEDSKDMGDIEEVFSNSDRKPANVTWDNVRSSDEHDPAKAEVRLTRPEDAEKRIAITQEEGYPQVPGTERIAKQETPESTPVPANAQTKGRAIASAPEVVQAPTPVSAAQPPIETPTRVVGQQKVMPPLVQVDLKPDTIVASSNPDPIPVYGNPMQEVSLIASDKGFFPNKIFVTQNVPVRIYMSSASQSTLCFMLDSWGLKKGVNPGRIEEISFVPDKPGTYRYYCPVKSLEGTLVVREPSVSGPSYRSLASEEPWTNANAAASNERMFRDVQLPKQNVKLQPLIED